MNAKSSLLITVKKVEKELILDRIQIKCKTQNKKECPSLLNKIYVGKFSKPFDSFEDDDDTMLSTSKGKQKSITARGHFSVNDKHYEILSFHRDLNPITATEVKHANHYTIANHYPTKNYI